MAKEFVVLHPVRHDGKGYNRGEHIAAVKLNEKEAVRLLALGVITEPSTNVVVVEATPVVLGETTLGKLTIDELNAYAVSRSITVKATTKAEILAEISQAVQAGADLKAAEELAAAQGR